MFLGAPDPDPFVRDPDPNPSIIKQNLDFFMTFLSMRNDVNVALKSNRQKYLEIKNFLVAVLKVTDEISRIRIRTKMSRIRNTG